MIKDLTEKFSGKGISFEEYKGFPAVRLQSELSTALISIYGAHVIEFALPESENVLWMSEKSLFAEGSPIRGGVPVCFPWFGAAPEGKSGSHGFVRNAMWDVAATGVDPAGGVYFRSGFSGDDRQDFYTAEFPLHFRSARIARCFRSDIDESA